MYKGSFITAARVALATVTLAALAGSATAADLRARAPAPYQPPPPPPPVFSWTGCYIGANIGGGWASKSSNDVAGAVTGVIGADLGSHTASGFIGGGQLGCDDDDRRWQEPLGSVKPGHKDRCRSLREVSWRTLSIARKQHSWKFDSSPVADHEADNKLRLQPGRRI